VGQRVARRVENFELDGRSSANNVSGNETSVDTAILYPARWCARIFAPVAATSASLPPI